MVLLGAIQAVTVPLRIAFDRDGTIDLYHVDVMNDVIMMFDVFVNFASAYENK